MPEPILVTIAAALAAKSIGPLYDLVRNKFASRKQATAALETAHNAAPDSPAVHTLANHLAQAIHTDPDFAAALHATWAQLSASDDATINQVSGTIQGNLIQARDIHGNITFS